MMPHQDSWSITQLSAFLLPKIFFSIVCGGIIGLERELKNKAAGIKTNILICVGSMLYTSVSVLIASEFAEQGHYGDPGRLAAQIVSGIGFLGGGAIIQARGTILGLTTAATIWLVAAIGVCIGIGHWDIGLICSVTAVLILVATNVFEDKILGRYLSFACEITVDDPDGRVRASINQSLGRNDLILEDFEAKKSGEDTLLSLTYSGHRGDNKKFILDLWGTPGIREVRQL